MKKIILENSWKEKLLEEFNKDYMQSLSVFLRSEKSKNKIIFPPGNKIFNAFNLTKFEDVKVVILGQDPYHGLNQAHGLSFSVEEGIRPPPSLKNIFKELESDMGIKQPEHGNLERWCSEGVLLLNSILTVEKSKPASHANMGWEQFTDKILSILNDLKETLFLFYGGKRPKKKVISWTKIVI